MLKNIILATGHIRANLEAAGESETDRKVMTYLEASDGEYYVLDSTGNYWTLFLYIRDSYGIEEVTKPEQAYSAGKAFRYSVLIRSYSIASSVKCESPSQWYSIWWSQG